MSKIVVELDVYVIGDDHKVNRAGFAGGCLV